MACSRAVTGTVAALVALVVLVLLTIGRVAHADTDVDTRQVETYVVQERLFRQGLELNAGIGLLPLNAFSKGWMVNGSVTYHFSNVLAWEIGQGGYVFANMDTGLKRQLLNNFGVQPTQLSRDSFLVGLALARYEDPGAFQQGADVGLGLRWYLGPQVSLRFDARDYLLFESFSNFSLTNELLVSVGISVAFGGNER
jgi:hypothetical protein